MEIFEPKNLKRLALCATLPLATIVGCGTHPSETPRVEQTPTAPSPRTFINVQNAAYVTRVNDETLFIGTEVSGQDGYGMALGISYLREHGCVIRAISPVSGGNLVDSSNCLSTELK